MNGLLLWVAVFLAGMLERGWPTTHWLALARPPLLLCVALYYGLRHRLGPALGAALAAGLLADLPGNLPLGYATGVTVLLVLWTRYLRRNLVTDSPVTHAVLVVLGALAGTLLTWLLLWRAGLVAGSAGWVLVRTLATGLLGLLAAPAVFVLLDRAEHGLGVNAEGTLLHEADYKA